MEPDEIDDEGYSCQQACEDAYAFLAGLRELNADGKLTRNREMSLAVTNLEQAIHWLERSCKPTTYGKGV